MAAAFRRAPAITPDARRRDHHSVAVVPRPKTTTAASSHRAVTFGFGSLKTPTAPSGSLARNVSNNASGVAAGAAGREDALRQYAMYRSSAGQFPSYERLRFVRLPEAWLPARLRGSSDLTSNNNIGDIANGGDGRRWLPNYWPALVYQNLAELVRDLSPTENRILKAKLILEHRKCPTAVVARLLAWKSSSRPSAVDGLFEEGKLELIRLSGSSLEENEDPDSGYAGELLGFVDSQLELEGICDELLSREADEGVVEHALQFRRAVDMALNCIALDVGSDPLPPRDEDEHVGRAAAIKTPTNGAAATAANRDATSTLNVGHQKSAFSSEKTAAKKKVNAKEPSVNERTEKKVAKVRAGREKGSIKYEPNKAGISKKFNDASYLADAAGDKENTRNVSKDAFSGAGARETKPARGLLEAKPSRGLMEAKLSRGLKETQPLRDANGSGGGFAAMSPMFQARAAAVKKKKMDRSNGLSSNTAAVNRPSSRPSSRPAKPAPSFAFYDPEGKESAGSGRPGSRSGSRPIKPMSKSSSSALSFTFNRQREQAAEESTMSVTEEGEEVSWKEVWKAMKASGWTWKGGTGLMTDYYYIRPGRMLSQGVQGQDYFTSVGATQRYARHVFGWNKPGVSRAELMSNIEQHSKHAGEPVPPLKDGVRIEPHEGWKEVWDKLLSSGWKWKAGSGLMMDYYYIKAGGRVKHGKKGEDYFVKREDVEDFVMRNYGWLGERQGNEVKAADGEGRNGVKTERRRSGSRLSGESRSQAKRQRIEGVGNTAKSHGATSGDEEKEQKPEEVQETREPTEEDNGDDVGSVASDTRSTFSQSGFRSNQALFREECVDAKVPPLVEPILPDEPWCDAWDKMRASGWTWRVGTGLMMDYFYIKPGIKKIGESVEGVDYFLNVEGAQRYASRNYGWRGDGKGQGRCSDGGSKRRCSSSVCREKEEEERKKRHRVEKAREHMALKKVQAPMKGEMAAPAPPLSAAAIDKKALWRAMQKEGWRAVSASRYNQLHDWYYVRPNCDPGDGASCLGVDYFMCEEDAIEHARKCPKSEAMEAKKPEATCNKQSSKPKARVVAAASLNGTLQTPPDCRTKPQDPAIPLLSSPESSSSSLASTDYYKWANLWPVLQGAGWRVIKAARYNQLHDWYYVRPGCDPGDGFSILGRHYFACQEDVVEFLRRLDSEGDGSGKKGEKMRRSGRRSMGLMLDAFEDAAKKEA